MVHVVDPIWALPGAAHGNLPQDAVWRSIVAQPLACQGATEYLTSIPRAVKTPEYFQSAMAVQQYIVMHCKCGANILSGSATELTITLPCMHGIC